MILLSYCKLFDLESDVCNCPIFHNVHLLISAYICFQLSNTFWLVVDVDVISYTFILYCRIERCTALSGWLLIAIIYIYILLSNGLVNPRYLLKTNWYIGLSTYVTNINLKAIKRGNGLGNEICNVVRCVS